METNDHPQHIRIVLGATASAALSTTGENCFVVVSRGTTDDPPGRWALHLLPCSVVAVNDAVMVAQGRAKARKIKSKSPILDMKD